MKILLVNKFLYPNGGSETYLFETGKQLERMGHEVQYFGMEHKGRIVGNHAESYTSDMDFHSGKLIKLTYPFRIIYSVEARKKIRRVLDDFQPDVVHLNNFNFQLTPSILMEIEAYRKQSDRGVRILYTAHDYQLVCPNHMMRIPLSGKNCECCLEKGFWQCTTHRCIHNSRLRSVLGSVESNLYHWLGTYRYLDSLICPSRFMKEKLDHNPLFSGKTVVMHNFVENRRREADSGQDSSGLLKTKKENAGKKFELNGEERKYVLYFGRFAEEKGVRTLLKACRKLPEIPFIFAGSGPLEAEVEGIKNVTNLGFQRGDALKQLVSGAAFSVYPSEWYENCPFSVMESISLGTPVIGADIGGIPELVEQGQTGELFASGDMDELCDKIGKLWADKKVLSKYTENCVKKDFDTVEKYCEKLVQLYSDCLL